ncbi:ATP phosphoribosyltransferase [Vallitalea okinawensis]|uniref:ATP phosphoribosyltransferase n=1 Tax=Vallitalea okinawensis TaxID=2078660 RepID=UPI000CFB8AD4|nr:ATP phosphoribosyltransferase [Vallitalea okinawensis]
MEYLTIAMAKGRLAKKTLNLFDEAGIPLKKSEDDSRKLIFTNEELKVKYFLSKASDVPTYVDYGVADIGVVGKDTLLEEKRNLYEILDLGFGKCHMVVAGMQGIDQKENQRIKVATKYPVIATDYYLHQKNQPVEIIKLHGSVELAPIIGLSDVIVDIVETGTTLKENGLEIYETICSLSARLVANRVSYKMKSNQISYLIEHLKKAILLK